MHEITSLSYFLSFWIIWNPILVKKCWSKMAILIRGNLYFLVIFGDCLITYYPSWGIFLYLKAFESFLYDKLLVKNGHFGDGLAFFSDIFAIILRHFELLYVWKFIRWKVVTFGYVPTILITWHFLWSRPPFCHFFTFFFYCWSVYFFLMFKISLWLRPNGK